MEILKSEIPFHCLILGPTKSGKCKYLVDVLRGPFSYCFDFIVLVCPTYKYNETYLNFGNGDKCFFAMIPDLNEENSIDECLNICCDLFNDNNSKKKKDKKKFS